ncbi:diguanylate cyclase [Aquipuribacter nitratireducens]|uniref:Diguanylate cyclase n=1 Tax=Aquipuribacter nitratireducens TaxID=650104 RepID=A0ABW0GSL0_9MICO
MRGQQQADPGGRAHGTRGDVPATLPTDPLAALSLLVDTDPVAATEQLDARLAALADGGPGDPEDEPRLLVLRARARHFRRDLRAHEDTARALELLDSASEPLLCAQALNMHAISSGYLGDLHAQLRCLDRGLEALLRTSGAESTRLRSVMRHNLAVALYDLGDARGALGLLEDARREARSLGHPRQQEWVLMSSVAAASFLLRGYEGQPPVDGEERDALLALVDEWTDEAVAAAERAVAVGEGMANRRGASWCLARRAQLRGDLDAALRHARDTVQLVGTLGEVDVLARSRALLAEVLLERGELDEAERILLDATASTDRLGSVTSVMVWHMLATCRERRGDLVGALAAMRRYVTAVTASRDMQVHSTAAVNAARLRREELERERDTWRRTSESERRAARVDALTGIDNRRSFTDAMADHATAGTRLALAIVDLDHFKAVNDRYGHVVGDEVLVRVAAAMSAALVGVAGAGFYRVGGEEFVVTFPVHDLDAAAVAHVVDTVRTAVTAVDFSDVPALLDEHGPLQVSASAGATIGVPVDAASPAGDLLRAADRHLYEAKRSGRDRLVGP